MYFLYGILYVMAVSCSRAGRPRWVAVLGSNRDKRLAFWDEFVNACSGFRYREIVAVSRACGLSTRAVENWKYGTYFPDKERAEEVLDWVRAGKPMEQQRPFPDSSML
jgi:hypothetical protein